ncbi:MAG: tail fiber protein [Bacteroidota bacterium]
MEFALGQIYMFAGNFAPRNWAFCDGALLPINNYQSLYSILGTTYGGDGRTSFGLPDLRGRSALHKGQGIGLSDNISLGTKSGQEYMTLTEANLPSHTHSVSASLNYRAEAGDETAPGGGSLAVAPIQMYHADGPTTNSNFHTGTITATMGHTGGGQSFNIRQPYQAVNYIICLQGLFPSRN